MIICSMMLACQVSGSRIDYPENVNMEIGTTQMILFLRRKFVLIGTCRKGRESGLNSQVPSLHGAHGIKPGFRNQ